MRKGAELYDPATGTLTKTGDMSTGRFLHRETLLNNGKALITGGTDGNMPSTTFASAELYDPTTGKFTKTGSMLAPRCAHTATPLNDGRVLVAGGSDDPKAPTRAELYDPETETFTATASLIKARSNHTATLLPDGDVLLAGGTDGLGDIFSSTELYGHSRD